VDDMNLDGNAFHVGVHGCRCNVMGTLVVPCGLRCCGGWHDVVCVATEGWILPRLEPVCGGQE